MKEITNNIEEVKDIHFYVFTAQSFNLMKQFSEIHQLNKYPNITVGQDTKDFFGNHLSVRGVPYIAIYDKNKILLKAFIGKTSVQLIKSIAKN